MGLANIILLLSFSFLVRSIIFIIFIRVMINPSLLADLEEQLEDLSDSHQIDEEDINLKIQQPQKPTDLKSKLLTLHRQHFLSHMANINEAIDETLMKAENKAISIKPDNKQIVIENVNKSNEYALMILKEVQAIAKFIKKIYNQKFPELENLVPNEGLYCRTILEIEESRQVDENDRFAYLNQHQKIALKISISSTRDPIPQQELIQILEAAKTAVQLHNHYETLMIFLQSYMNVIAPNLCQLVGSLIASKLIATAGGLDKLASTPACNIQVLGGTRSAQFGFSQMERNHTGVFGMMDNVKDAPKKFQMKLVRMLATNSAKCARADSLGTSPNLGVKLREEMYERFEKVQEEGGLMRQQKPMEIPDMQPKKKRGGKRHRKNKELHEMTQLKKQQNRLKFGEEAQEQIGEGVGLGMVKQAGLGKLRVQIKKQKLNNSKKMQQRINKKSGLESSLNLSAGIQLINPGRLQEINNGGQGNESYFKKQAGFRTVLNNKMMK